MNHREVVEKIWSAELAYRAEGRWPLFNPFSLSSFITKGVSTLNYNIGPAVYNQDRTIPQRMNFNSRSNMEFEEHLCEREKEVYNLLVRYSENLFIGGGYLTTYLRQSKPTFEDEDIDLFIVARSPEEAEDITTNIAAVLDIKSKQVVFHPEVTTWQRRGKTDVQVVRRLYTRRDQICGGYDLWPSQVIYSYKHGFECTLMGLYSLITGYFPNDVSRRSSSATHRHAKYILNKGFVMLMPGIPMHDSGSTCLDIKDNNIRVTMVANNRFQFSVTALQLYRSKWVDYGVDDDLSIEEGQYWHNWFKALEGDIFPLVVSKYSHLKDLTKEDLMCSCFYKFQKVSKHIRKYDIKILKQFFRTDDEWRVWSTLYYVDCEYKKAKQVWEENLWSYISHGQELCRDLTKFWKVKNPGEQRFGQNRPIPMTVREYYGENYTPTIIGISHEKYILLRLWIRDMCQFTSKVWPKVLTTYIIKLYLTSFESEVIQILTH